MDLDYKKDDFMMLDVEKAPMGRERERERDREKNRSMVVSVLSSPESHAVTLNGYGGSPGNSTLSNVDDMSASLLRRVNHAKGPPEHYSLEASRKNHPPSDEGSSDDLARDTMPRRLRFPAAALPTGLCYDVRMRYHCELDPPKQRLDFHPEDPRRIYSIYKELCLAGLVDDEMSTQPIVSTPLRRINARNATEAEICLVHDAKHFSFIEKTKGNIVMLHGG